MGADDGYFPRGTSILRRVHEERAVGLLFGQRALAIGAIHPPNFVGTIQHSRGLAKPFARLANTGKVFETIFFGSRADADRALAIVARQHADVTGVLPKDAGPAFPAGTPYSAYDPELMLWTVAVIADSARVFYELFVGRLSAGELDALWEDYLCFGELFGMPREVAPVSWAEFADYFDARLASDDAHLTEEALYIGSAIMFEIPVPPTHRAPMAVHNLIMRGSLPPRIRELYGLGWNPADAIAFRAAVTAARAARPIAPGRMRRGYNTQFFDLVARTERGRIKRGDPTPALV